MYSLIHFEMPCPHVDSDFQHTYSSRFLSGPNTHTYCVRRIWHMYSSRSPQVVLLSDLETSKEIMSNWGDPGQKHDQRVIDADLSYPIFLTTTMEIIDGYHRVIKARKGGNEKINAIILTDYDLSRCILS